MVKGIPILSNNVIKVVLWKIIKNFFLKGKGGHNEIKMKIMLALQKYNYEPYIQEWVLYVLLKGWMLEGFTDNHNEWCYSCPVLSDPLLHRQTDVIISI